MAFEPLVTAPTPSDFIPLSQHEEQTPGTFFGGKAVLHILAPASTLKISSTQFAQQPDLKQLTGEDVPASVDDQIHIPNIDIWVTSKHLFLFSPSVSAGLRISYPTITVTAQDGNDVLLELNLSHPDTADEDIEFMQMRISATRVMSHDDHTTPITNSTNGTANHNDATIALYGAISDCQELNPDLPAPGEEGYGEGGFDETAPGATGWITSENMANFMDEDGHFRMPEGMTVIGGAEEDGRDEGESLGQGAGRTRTAAEALEEEETKWRRTS